MNLSPNDGSIGLETGKDFCTLAHSSRTELLDLMARPSRSIDWSALRAAQERHYQRMSDSKLSDQRRRAMSGPGGLLDMSMSADLPGQNASWDNVDSNPSTVNNSQSPSPVLAPRAAAAVQGMPASSAAFIEILRTSTSSPPLDRIRHDNGNETQQLHRPTKSIRSSNDFTLIRNTAERGNGISATSSNDLKTPKTNDREQGNIKQVRSDQWLLYRKRLEASGVPVELLSNNVLVRDSTIHTAVAAATSVTGLPRSLSSMLLMSKSTSKRGLVLSRSLSSLNRGHYHQHHHQQNATFSESASSFCKNKGGMKRLSLSNISTSSGPSS